MKKVARKARYDPGLPQRMYKYFVGYGDVGAPSFVKFARLSGYTTAELESFRDRVKFDRAWRECSEIRRDYLIDMALTKRHDASFTKFLMQEEHGSGTDESEDEGLDVRVEIVPD